MTEITLIGNEGFRLRAGETRIFIDAFFHPFGEEAERLAWRAADIRQADLILVTHAHYDHFDADAVVDVATRTGARVIGPRAVVRAIGRRLAADAMIELEPELVGRGAVAASVRHALPQATVTAYRTFHSRDHNSYLIEAGGVRLFHDGDNEDTRRLPVAELGRVDALLIGPWQGSDWVAFIHQLQPRHWFLMHLSAEELAEQDAGRFLPETCGCARVPPGLVVLHPGESFALDPR